MPDGRPTPQPARLASWPAELRERLAPGVLIRFLGTAFQLGLIVLLVRAFQIESRAFLYVSVLIWCGFVVHHFLARALRLPFFALLSIGGSGLVFGPADAAWLVALGLGLLGLAHLPVPFAARVALLLAAGAGLAALRGGWLPGPVPEAIWPIFGAMFMFRTIVYLYDLRSGSAPVGLWRALAYFFLLPSPVFPLFPVIDYRAFCRTWYDREEIRIYQEGVQQIFRGCLHLLAYRVVYQNLLIDPATIASSLDAARFVVTTYLLYLKVSGSFHLIVGLLHLFGFRLPETHHDYLLASSFTDFWRRINIYWKDFIQKCFFNPVYFATQRRIGRDRAIALAAAWAFLATWLLHSYQWFWIRGSFSLAWQDGAFWTLLCLVVTANMLWEVRHGRSRTLGKVRHTLRSDLLLGLRSAGMFVAIATLWSLWSAESWAELRHTFASLVRMSGREAALYAAALSAFGALAILLSRWSREQTDAAGRAARERQPLAGIAYWRPALGVCAGCLLLLGLAERPGTLSVLPAAVRVLEQVRNNDRLSGRDARLLERGYYEDLTDVTRFNAALQEVLADRPPGWNDAPMVKPHTPYPPYKITPDADVTFKGARLRSNRWGMRDRDYALEKSPGVHRIALLGASHEMGSGVEDDETFENLVEERLERERGPGEPRVEILNFSVGGYGPLSRLAVLRDEAARFAPDAVLYGAIDDPQWVINELASAASAEGVVIPEPWAREVGRQAQLEPGLAVAVAEERLRPFAPALVERAYRELVAEARRLGAEPLFMIVPRPEPESSAYLASAERLEQAAVAAGFTLLDVGDAYASEPDPSRLWIARWDRHPNARGHALVAEALYRELSRHLRQSGRRAALSPL